MVNLKHLTLEEIIYEGVHGNIQLTDYKDWIILEEKLKGLDYISEDDLQSQLDSTADCNYTQGLEDGWCERNRLEERVAKLEGLLEENKIEY